jgi:hypothetical protein
MEAIRSSEALVHTRSTQRHIPEDGILHSHRCDSLKSYIEFQSFWAVSNFRHSEEKNTQSFGNCMYFRPQVKAY